MGALISFCRWFIWLSLLIIIIFFVPRDENDGSFDQDDLLNQDSLISGMKYKYILYLNTKNKLQIIATFLID